MQQTDQPEPPAGGSQNPENLGQALVYDEADDHEKADQRGDAEMKAKGS